MEFSNTEELLAQARKDRACLDGRNWCRNRPLEAILETIPHNYRLWCLLHGYTQFAEHCDWDRYKGEEWSGLLAKQPQFAEHCDWGKLDGWDWSWLLTDQPQFAEHCDWEKFSGYSWAWLLNQPQFAKYRPTQG